MKKLLFILIIASPIISISNNLLSDCSQDSDCDGSGTCGSLGRTTVMCSDGSCICGGTSDYKKKL